jgi:hypothetical protein
MPSPTTRELRLQIEALDRLAVTAFTERDKALRLAMDSINERLKLLNEFRAQSADESKRYATLVDIEARFRETNRVDDRLRKDIEHIRTEALSRENYEERHAAVISRLDKIDNWRANVAGRSVAVGIFGAIFIATTAAIITHLVQ